jgi:hypothetical protein
LFPNDAELPDDPECSPCPGEEGPRRADAPVWRQPKLILKELAGLYPIW